MNLIKKQDLYIVTTDLIQLQCIVLGLICFFLNDQSIFTKL